MAKNKDNPTEIKNRIAMVREESLAKHAAKGKNLDKAAKIMRVYYLANYTKIREQQRVYEARRKGKIEAKQIGDN